MKHLFDILTFQSGKIDSVKEICKKLSLQAAGKKQRLKAERELAKLKKPEYPTLNT